MKKEVLQQILTDIRGVKIGVIGDFCLDAYWFVDETMSEISVETNQITRPVSQQRYSPGGAGNVTNNLAAMGVGEIVAFGVIGSDPFGTEMIRIMKQTGIKTENLIIQENDWSTHTYAKPYIGDQELNRVDFGNYNQLSRDTADRLIRNLVQKIDELDVIIINQQVPSGIHTGYFRQRLTELIATVPEKIFIVDSRQYNDIYNGCIRKMNDTEAVRLCGLPGRPEETIAYAEVVSAAKELFSRYQKPLFITRGNKGSIAIDQTGISEIPGMLILAKVDTVGAGDSYLAGVAATLGAGYDLETAAHIGSFVAGVTVTKLFQTGTASPDEILAIGVDPDYIFEPELAGSRRHARYFPESEIEIVNNREAIHAIEHAIFDHDGTISTLREGWEMIMAPMMIKAILGKKFQEADEGTYHKVKTRVDEFIDRTTGMQTLAQMKGLIELIREFGFVDDPELLDEFGYKKVYNDELLIMVKEREKKLSCGELSQEDFTMKNAVPFLQKLYNAGVKLYLASGTDVADVKNEARVLGYEHLFEGRIYGAVGDISKEAKKIVLDQILDSIGNTAYGKIVTFGDGPVEIRETRKRGGITVGVASNEIRRYGLNDTKRTRLIRAGADIVIPDFTQSAQLLDLLKI